jgi:hypothetical protein
MSANLERLCEWLDWDSDEESMMRMMRKTMMRK